MTLLVHNEAQTLEEHLLYHLNQGVDVVLAIDDRSTDGATDVLESFVRGGHVSIVPRPPGRWGGSSSAWRTLLARLAFTEHRADWVLAGDPDEFWWPLAGDLKAALGGLPDRSELVFVPRTDVVFTGEPKSSALRELTVRERRSPLDPKVCFRGSASVVLDRGSHRAMHAADRDALGRWDAGQPMRLAPFTPLRIFHFGLRSSAQLERRLQAGTARNSDVLVRRGGVDDLSPRSVEPAARWRQEAIEQGLREGELVVDQRFREVVDRLKDPRVHPLPGPRAPEEASEHPQRTWSAEAIEIQELVAERLQERELGLRRRFVQAQDKHRASLRKGPLGLARRLTARLGHGGTYGTPPDPPRG
ncbi:MAG: glycosyltransferase family 2 protein [Solirubrobacterales bacterium]